MFNMKDLLLTKSFKEEQYDNELAFIVSNWFDDLLVDERIVTDGKGFEPYKAMLNGKPYYLYPYGNTKKFVLVPYGDDLFAGDFDDIITFYKNDKSLFIDIKNKKNGLYTDTTYSITMDDFNDIVKCLATYKEYNDKNNYIYEITQNSDSKDPYKYFGSLQIRYSDYWYKGAMTRNPSQTIISERDSKDNEVIVKDGVNTNKEYSGDISMISIINDKLTKDRVDIKHHGL